MSLTAGTKIEPYQVIAELGRGGPPTLPAAFGRQLRRGLAVAQARTCR
jgi:hypothetical protein